jgi:hypothetical protein
LLAAAQIRYASPPSAVPQRVSNPATHLAALQPGWYVIGITSIHGRTKEHAYFKELRPIARIGYSMSIYHVAPWSQFRFTDNSESQDQPPVIMTHRSE